MRRAEKAAKSTYCWPTPFVFPQSLAGSEGLEVAA
jgi:hypothetical protein